jgi:hypothetical protein
MYNLHLSFLIGYTIRFFFGSGVIRTHAIEMTGAWKKRIRPHSRTTAVVSYFGNEETVVLPQQISVVTSNNFSKKIKWQ